MRTPFFYRSLSTWRVSRPAAWLGWGAAIAIAIGMAEVRMTAPPSVMMAPDSIRPPDKMGKNSVPDILPLDALARRNIFLPLISAPPRPKALPVSIPITPPAPKIPLSQKASRFHLVGIIPGNPAQAVLEDAQGNKTLYVTAGQLLDDVRVDKVLRDRIVLTCGDEHMDLML